MFRLYCKAGSYLLIISFKHALFKRLLLLLLLVIQTKNLYSFARLNMHVLSFVEEKKKSDVTLETLSERAWLCNLVRVWRETPSGR